MTRLKTPFYPADSSNYTVGRGGKKIKNITFHHTAAANSTLRYLWADPNRNGSSHYFVGTTNKYEQYVKEANTAWTNGNFSSNQESITIETRGDWRFGYKSQETIDNLVALVRDIRLAYPGITYNIHRDVSLKGTVCPGDLPVDLIWKASVPVPTVKKPEPVLRVDIKDKKIELLEDTNIWDMSFTTWSGKNKPKAVGSLKAGTVIDIAGEYDHPLSSVDYYLSKWAWDNNKNWGISKSSKVSKTYVAPKPVKVPAKTPTVDNPAKPAADESPKGGQGIDLPLPIDENGEKLNKIYEIVLWVQNTLKRIFNIQE